MPSFLEREGESGRWDWFGWAFRLPFPYFETDGKRDEREWRGERAGQQQASLFSCRPRERERKRISAICFSGYMSRGRSCGFGEVQPQPLPGAGTLSLPALTNPPSRALASMRTHPETPRFPSSFQPHRSSTPALVIIGTVHDIKMMALLGSKDGRHESCVQRKHSRSFCG
jgi:hypothetical protein